ncbi:Art9 [Drosophila busckii]|uniref:Art9 n=1 Tax=Drosophila busckii TaxID=30019 RepID=A0A0M3QXW0_DROBS|nr:Art9 [Drosophila busckii]
MLADVLISNVYSHFIAKNAALFKDKIVLDVGCRSGLLSILAVESGAVKVFAVGNMQSAKHVTQLLADGEKAEIFEPLTGSLSQIRLPSGLRKVDIIVSEWMGNALFADSLFCDVIYARDKWLIKGGWIIPNIAQLYIVGIGSQLSCPKPLTSTPVDAYVEPESVLTQKFLLKNFNLNTANEILEYFQVDFKLRALRKDKLCACLLYFEIGCTDAKGSLQKLFSIAPEAPRTHLQPTLLFLQQVDDVADQELVAGRFFLALTEFSPRGVEFGLDIVRRPKTDVVLK